jgi:SAM-dependent methyltransferase
MSVYAGRYAELYDLFYADKPYADEAQFVHECIQDVSSFDVRQILEIACGTGRHAFELEKYGYDVTAVDQSPDMLQIARRRAAKNNSKLDFITADMQQLELIGKKWDAALCLFDSIGYLTTNEALRTGLRGIWNCLRHNGLFIFEFWHAPAILNEYSPVRVRRAKTDNSEAIRISETALDRENRTAKVDYTIYELRNDGTYETFCEAHSNRFFLVNEMRILLSDANFKALKFFAGFTKTQPITDKTWHVVAVARKISGSNSS